MVSLLRVLGLEEHLRAVMHECCSDLNLEARLFLSYLFSVLKFSIFSLPSTTLTVPITFCAVS
jgi:hypothetical protein